MLRCGTSIRLTQPEIDCLNIVTGHSPVGIRTVDELDMFIDRCKRKYRGFPDTPKLYAVIDAVVQRILDAT